MGCVCACDMMSMYVHAQDSWSYKLHHSSAVLANCKMMQRSINLTEPSTSVTTLNILTTSGITLDQGTDIDAGIGSVCYCDIRTSSMSMWKATL